MGKINIYDSETFTLFKQRPSFITGVFDLFSMGSVSKKYKISASPEEADINALASDWKQVGKDIRSAFATYEEGQL